MATVSFCDQLAAIRDQTDVGCRAAALALHEAAKSARARTPVGY
jgi:hypothetical protein